MSPLLKLDTAGPITSFHPIVYGMFYPPDLVGEFALLIVVAPVPTAVNLDKIT